MKTKALRNLTVSAVCLALAYVLPFVTGGIARIGNMLCPMHIPVLLCGFLCGGPWGAVVGFVAPLLRSLTMGKPVLFPTGISMMFELAAYGFFSGLFYRIFPKKVGFLYMSLVLSMLCGRIVMGVANVILYTVDGRMYTWPAFLAGALMTAIPGIIVQLALIPPVVLRLDMQKKKGES